MILGCRPTRKTPETRCGTERYAAAEIFAGKSYDSKVDTWSIGVVLLEMVIWRLPKIINDAKKWALTIRRIVDEGMQHVTVHRALLSKRLQLYPKACPTPAECLPDLWFSMEGSLAGAQLSERRRTQGTARRDNAASEPADFQRSHKTRASKEVDGDAKKFSRRRSDQMAAEETSKSVVERKGIHKLIDQQPQRKHQIKPNSVN